MKTGEMVSKKLFIPPGRYFCRRKSVSALADRRREKGVSSLQEPLYASISARKPAFPHSRQGNAVQFRKSTKKGFPWKSILKQ